MQNTLYEIQDDGWIYFDSAKFKKSFSIQEIEALVILYCKHGYTASEIAKRKKMKFISPSKKELLVTSLDNSRSPEIEIELNFSKEDVEQIVKCLKITHSSLPIIPEQKSNTTCFDAIVENSKYDLEDKLQKHNLETEKKDAERFRLLKHGKYDPFENVLKTFKEVKIKDLGKNINLQNNNSTETFVVVLSDLHFGSYANAKYMFNNKGWDTKKTEKALNDLIFQIEKTLSNRKNLYKKCVIVGLGDMIHSLLGKTQRGTELIFDTIKEEQFEYALNSLFFFVNKLVKMFKFVDVFDVSGNHHYELDMALFKALAMYFKDNKNVKFQHFATRPSTFSIGKSLFLIDHGADSKERVYVPSGSKLENHVAKILLNNRYLMNDTEHVYFLQGDRHHWEHLEFSNFEFLMFGTINCNDEHSNVNNWHNRARQSCLVIDDNDGLKEVMHFYTKD